MTGARLLFPILLFSLIIPLRLSATPLADNSVVVIVQTGRNNDGTGIYEVADSSDDKARQMWNLAKNDSGMQRVLRFYHDIQVSKIPAELSMYNQADPLYIEVRNASGGAFCDWKADFTLVTPQGETRHVTSPKVVTKRNDPVFNSGDRALQAQTLVHETGHGAMAKLYGYERLPSTEWLGKDHSGGSVTDEKLALIEGWAEFVGAYFSGRHTIANDPSRAMDDNIYAYKDIFNRGALRSRGEMLRTEGWVGTALLKLVENHALDIDDLATVLAKKQPRTLDEVVEGIEEIYPGKSGKVHEVLADTSLGALCPELYQPRETGEQPAKITASPFPYGRPAGGSVTRPVDYGRFDNDDKTLRMVAGLAGAVLGAMAGGPFGIVGAIVGAGIGVALSQAVVSILGGDTRPSAASPLYSAYPAPAAPAAVGSAPDQPALDKAPVKLNEIEKQMRRAFEIYVLSVRKGTPEQQRLALKNYKKLKALRDRAVRPNR